MIRITDDIAIEPWEITETFTRSSGPGGQNVNKVETAVVLRFEAARSPNLPGYVKHRLRALAGKRWTADGAIVIHAERHRSQARNREDALARLIALIAQATERPKRRVATKPSKSSQRKRVEAKKQRGSVKALRGKPDFSD